MADLSFDVSSDSSVFFTRCNDISPGTFCSPNNIDHCLAYLSKELEALGFSLPTNLAHCEYPSLINALYGVLGLHRKNIKQREEYDDRISRLISDLELQRSASGRLKDKLEQAERSLQSTVESNRQTVLKLKALQSDLKAEKDETKRLQSLIQQRDAQYHHEKRRKEKECDSIKERLHHAMNDKKLEKKLGFDMTNVVPRAGGKRGKWNTSVVSSRNEEDLQTKIMAGYENRNKILLGENILMRETLCNMYKNLMSISSSENQENASSVEPAQTISVVDTDCALPNSNHISSPIFQMPYQPLVKKIQTQFDDMFKAVKQKLCLFDELLEKEWNSRKQAYQDQINQLNSKIEVLEETVERQSIFLKASININGSPNSNTKDIVEEKETFEMQREIFMEMKQNFNKEREIYTDAILRLARERRAFYKEKSDFLQQQLSPISPPQNHQENTTSITRILPSLNDRDEMNLPMSKLNLDYTAEKSDISLNSAEILTKT